MVITKRLRLRKFKEDDLKNYTIIETMIGAINIKDMMILLRNI